jgi:pimeloyl-ACP methyl ester carboxylesterase
VVPTLAVGGTQIWYAEQGDRGTGLPLILVHGAGGSHLDWPGELRRLSQHPVITIDLPGHGKSGTEGRNTIADYAGDMLGLMDALALNAAVIAGHSMGGGIALAMALLAPERVRGLVLIATGARLPVNPALRSGFIEDPAATATMMARWMWAPQVSDAVREQGVARLLALAPAVVAADFEACDGFDVRDRLSEIAMPTLILCGDADRMTPLKFSERLRDGIAGADLQVVAGAGHMLPQEQPEVVAGALRQWLERSPRA